MFPSGQGSRPGSLGAGVPSRSVEEDSVEPETPGRFTEALCLETGPRPTQNGTNPTHRKCLSLDYGNGNWNGHPVWDQDCRDRPRPGQETRLVLTLGATPSYGPRDSESESDSPDSEPGSLLFRTSWEANPESGGSDTRIREASSHTGPAGLGLVPELALAPALNLEPGLVPVTPTVERRVSKRERNRLRSLRRRQRRRERWRQNQVLDNVQISTVKPSSSSSSSSSSEDEDLDLNSEKESCICAVCLDVYFCPYMCHPCHHVFCEPCLRTLAKNCPSNTPCPLCRTTITHVLFQKELNLAARTFFPKEYLIRKQTFQKASCAKWPLPSCRKLFRIFGGFPRQAGPVARRHFPHGAGFRLDASDFEDESRGWRFDMDMVIIYIYSVNWVIGFVVLCFLMYCFFPSL